MLKATDIQGPSPQRYILDEIFLFSLNFLCKKQGFFRKMQSDSPVLTRTIYAGYG
jgi:hypothetical protein